VKGEEEDAYGRPVNKMDTGDNVYDTCLKLAYHMLYHKFCPLNLKLFGVPKCICSVHERHMDIKDCLL
jgi:hypothetical protein